MGISYMMQGVQHSVLWQPRGVVWGTGWGAGGDIQDGGGIRLSLADSC